MGFSLKKKVETRIYFNKLPCIQYCIFLEKADYNKLKLLIGSDARCFGRNFLGLSRKLNITKIRKKDFCNFVMYPIKFTTKTQSHSQPQ